jgi:uncharacterized Rmd1/YagE family protein
MFCCVYIPTFVFFVLLLQDIVEVTRDLPEALAEFGRVQISRKQVARLIGQVRPHNMNKQLLLAYA